jgi:hypothetical protein
VAFLSAFAARIPPRAALTAAQVLGPLLAFLQPASRRTWRENVRALAVSAPSLSYATTLPSTAPASASPAGDPPAGDPPAGEPPAPGPPALRAFPSLFAVAPFVHHLLVHYETFAMLGGRRFSIEVEGEEHLHTALAGGAGVLVATAHVGNGYLGAHWLHERTGRAVHTVAGTQIGRGWTREIRLACRRRGIRIHSRRHAAPLLLRALRAGEIVALHLDGDQHEGSGLATRGSLLLARRARAPVLFATSERRGPGRLRIRFSAPLGSDGTGSDSRTLARRLRELITARSEEWAIFRRLASPSEGEHRPDRGARLA